MNQAQRHVFRLSPLLFVVLTTVASDLGCRIAPDKEGSGVRADTTVERTPVARARNNSRPTDVAVLFDHSFSMTADKLDRARAAVRTILTQLGDQDRFMLVTFATDATTLAEPAFVSERSKSDWLEALDAIEPPPDSTTDLVRGIEHLFGMLAQLERPENRPLEIVLITDGLPVSSDRDALSLRSLEDATSAVAGRHRVWTVGVGHRVHEDLLQRLAKEHGGRYFKALLLEDPSDLIVALFAPEAHPK